VAWVRLGSSELPEAPGGPGHDGGQLLWAGWSMLLTVAVLRGCWGQGRAVCLGVTEAKASVPCCPGAAVARWMAAPAPEIAHLCSLSLLSHSCSPGSFSSGLGKFTQVLELQGIGRWALPWQSGVCEASSVSSPNSVVSLRLPCCTAEKR